MATKYEKLASGYVKRLHVDQHAIRNNINGGDILPPITIQTSSGSIKCMEARILGESRLVYKSDDPLSCGARLWLETSAEVILNEDTE